MKKKGKRFFKKRSNCRVRIGEGRICCEIPCDTFAHTPEHEEYVKKTKDQYFSKWDRCRKCRKIWFNETDRIVIRTNIMQSTIRDVIDMENQLKSKLL